MKPLIVHLSCSKLSENLIINLNAGTIKKKTNAN